MKIQRRGSPAGGERGAMNLRSLRAQPVTCRVWFGVSSFTFLVPPAHIADLEDLCGERCRTPGDSDKCPREQPAHELLAEQRQSEKQPQADTADQRSWIVPCESHGTPTHGLDLPGLLGRTADFSSGGAWVSYEFRKAHLPRRLLQHRVQAGVAAKPLNLSEASRSRIDRVGWKVRRTWEPTTPRKSRSAHRGRGPVPWPDTRSQWTR